MTRQGEEVCTTSSHKEEHNVSARNKSRMEQGRDLDAA